MATQTTDIEFEQPGLAARASGFFRAIGSALVAMAEANPRLKLAQRLSEMSDAQLAERGLQREDIVRYAFRDMYYA